MQNVLSQKEVNPGTNVSLAHAHGYLKISRNHLLRVYRDVPARNDAIPESEIDLPAEHPTSVIKRLTSTMSLPTLANVDDCCTSHLLPRVFR